MVSLVSLEDGEEEIADLEEVLFRQITPHIYVSESGIPASFAFGPATSDNGKPSFSRGSKTTAKDAFDWHNENARSRSEGVWGVSVDEVRRSDLTAVDDSQVTVNPPAAPAHCYVDYRELSKSQVRDRRARLLRFALQRGRLHP